MRKILFVVMAFLTLAGTVSVAQAAPPRPPGWQFGDDGWGGGEFNTWVTSVHPDYPSIECLVSAGKEASVEIDGPKGKGSFLCNDPVGNVVIGMEIQRSPAIRFDPREAPVRYAVKFEHFDRVEAGVAMTVKSPSVRCNPGEYIRAIIYVYWNWGDGQPDHEIDVSEYPHRYLTARKCADVIFNPPPP